METKTQVFTVFFDDGGYQDTATDQGEFAGVGLQELIDMSAARWRNCAPIAWAPSLLDQALSTLFSESLAAGRTIQFVDGRYVARGVELKPTQTLGDLLRKAGQGLPSKTPTLDKLENGRDPKRAPLPYFAERTPFDPFKGFVCVSSTQHQDAFGFSPDLQPSSHLVAPAHGSALLRG